MVFLRGILFCTLLILFHPSFLFGTEIKQVDKIILSQEREALLAACPFAVTEDGFFIVPDVKAGNIKIFNTKGSLVKVWGKKGPGPDEFGFPSICDYDSPYFSLIDYIKRKTYLFERGDDFQFNKKKEYLSISSGYDLEIAGKNILCSGHIINSMGQEYELYMRDLGDDSIEYLLPSERKYGYSSRAGYRNDFLKKIVPIGTAGFCTSEGDYAYFIWEGRLQIFKINLQTHQIDTFGTKTKNYIQPHVSKSLLDAYNSRDRERIQNAKNDMSYISGIFSDERTLGVIYGNFHKGDSTWKMILQLYSLNGNLLAEMSLPEAETYDDVFYKAFFYDKKKKMLHFLSRKLTKESADEYIMLKYVIME